MQNKSLTLFTFQSACSVRVERDHDGEPLFHANDICELLEYSNPRDAVRRHVDKDDVVKRDTIDRLKRKQQVNYVREPGMWSLILGSETPRAKEVKRWVTAEVLPAIRKTGAYIHQPAMHTSLTQEQRQTIENSVHSIATIWVFRSGQNFIYNHLRVAFQVTRWQDIPNESYPAVMALIDSKREAVQQFVSFVCEARDWFQKEVLSNGQPWTPSIKSKLTAQLGRQVVSPPKVDWLALEKQTR